MLAIRCIFYALSFLIPLVLYPYTSEIFEFNKIVVLYGATSLIVFFWAVECIIREKIIFKRSKLDVLIILFLSAMLISSLLSIDVRTSIFGYYSRFNGGLLSLISYSTLYWAFVTFMDKKSTKRFLYLLLLSTFIAALYSSFEHFGHSISCVPITGFNVDCWVQDVQNRVYGTFGQPNWLAAWLVATIPFSLHLLKEKFSQSNRSLLSLIVLFSSLAISVIALHYTKSRSGILALGVSWAIYWLFTFLSERRERIQSNSYALLVSILILTAVVVLINTPWRPALFDNITVNDGSTVAETAPALEVNITPSGEIRKVVWKGAWNLFAKYPLFGSGLETFALSYYQTRPLEHNLLSEWNFLYNKAHNEYLNYLSTTGLLGAASYLLLIAGMLVTIYRSKSTYKVAVVSSLSSIFVTNFFGFSVVPVNFLFFLIPAVVVSSRTNLLKSNSYKLSKLSQKQKILLTLSATFIVYSLLLLSRYWFADYNYSTALRLKDEGDLVASTSYLDYSVKHFPNEPIFSIELAELHALISKNITDKSQEAISVNSFKQSLDALKAADGKYDYNVKLMKQVANVYSDLAKVDANLLLNEQHVLIGITKLAPSDASTSYRLATNFAKAGNVEQAVKQLVKTIDMRPNYKLARTLLGYIYEDIGEVDLAKQQYEYILTKIDPNDQKIKDDLDRINSDSI